MVDGLVSIESEGVEVVICPLCRKAELKSRVYALPRTSFCMAWEPYYDEEGRFHMHDPNISVEPYRCSLGHRFNVRCQGCGSCDWKPSAKDCFERADVGIDDSPRDIGLD